MFDFKYFCNRNVSKYQKRAIQFGTRIAKKLNIKTFGSNKKAKGTANFSLKK